MDLAALDIKIGADFTELEKATPKFNAEMNKMATSVTKTNVALDKSANSLAKFGAANAAAAGGMSKTTKGSANATQALTNLGRVAQDLPFGFIGIANNLNPLLESFQALSVQAKSTGVSLSSVLLKSLTGAGGIGIALSVVTSALSFASLGLSAWTRGFSNNKKAVQENTKAVDEYVEALNRSYQAAGQQLAQVAEQVAAAQKIGISLKERQSIISQLQQTNSQYFGNLRIEGDLVIGLSQAYDNYANAILRVARAKAAQETVQKLATDLVKTSDAVNNIDVGLTNLNLTFQQASKLLAGEQTGNAFEDISKASQKLNDIVASGLPTFEQLKLLSEATGISENELNKRLAQRQLLKTKELSLTTQIASLSKFIAENDHKSVAADKTKVEQAETVSDVLAKLKLQLDALGTRELFEGLNLSDEKINRIRDAINRLVIDFKVPADSTIIAKLFGDINDIKFGAANFREFINKLEKSLPEAVPINVKPVLINDRSFGADFSKRMIAFQQALSDAAALDIDIPENIKNLFSIDGESYKEFLDKIKGAKGTLASLNVTVQDFLKGLETTAIVAFGEAIGTAFSGGNVEDVFKNLFATIGDALQALGKTMITLSPLITAIKVAINSLNPILALAAGVALTALGSFIENSVPKLAQGGIVPAGYPNDSYPALLSSNEAVIPLDRLNQFIQPQSSQVVVLESVVRGQDLVLVQQRTERKNRRTY